MHRTRKLLFLVNPQAGKAAIRGQLLRIVDTFVRAGWMPTIYTSQRTGELPALVAREAPNYDLVVCSGGDGTLNETLNGLMHLERRPPLGYIPAGTTNDFASSLGIPKTMLKAAQAAVDGVPVSVDVGKFGERFFAYVAAFGAFTDVTYVTPQHIKNSLGRLAYLVEGAQRLSSLKTYPLHLEYDGGETDGEFLVGLISNSSYVAGLPVGRWIDTSMSDGLLEVTLVRKPNLMIELTRVASNLLLGELDPELIFSVKTKRLRITSPEPIPWTLDGEYGGSHKQVDLRICPGQLRILVPEQYAEQPEIGM
jgi:YegS/Rv2252/BmrU family lipid kinase